MKGMMFTFEGIDGCGKSTTVPLVAQALRAKGYDVVETCEPTKTEFGMKVRELLFNSCEIADLATFFLFLADRAEHIAKTVTPAIESGKIVLCDRFDMSTLVYQDLVNIPKWTDEINKKYRSVELSSRGLDISRVCRILLDCVPYIAFERLQRRGVLNKYDNVDIKQLAKLKNDYLRLNNNGYFGLCVDSSFEQNTIANILIDYIEREIKLKAEVLKNF